MKIFSGSSNRPLASTIARGLAMRLEDTLIKRFSNDNLYIQLGVSVRSRRPFSCTDDSATGLDPWAAAHKCVGMTPGEPND